MYELIAFYLLGCISVGISAAMAVLYFLGGLTWPWYSSLIPFGAFVCLGIGMLAVKSVVDFCKRKSF